MLEILRLNKEYCYRDWTLVNFPHLSLISPPPLFVYCINEHQMYKSLKLGKFLQAAIPEFRVMSGRGGYRIL